MKPIAIAAARFVFGLRRPDKLENTTRLAQRGESIDQLIIREARQEDVPALAALHVETWRSTYQDLRLIGKVQAPKYEVREWQWREAFIKNDGTWFCYVVERQDGQLVGFTKGVHTDATRGELSKIYLLRDYQRLGLGKKLIGLVARRFLDEGKKTMAAYVDPSNPSCGFFESLGGRWLREPSGEINYTWYVWDDLRQLADRTAPALA